MQILDIRERLKTTTIYHLPLRVTFYARVSTDKDEQLNSLENQEGFFTAKIKENSAWIFVPGYIDEGISGTSVTKRERFLEMIRDAQQGKFDLILTKEVSRFARNTVDSLTYTRDLLRNGVGVFFMNDGINTLDPDSELRLTIMSGIAQDESRKISSRVRFGSREAIKKGRVFGNSRIYGYDYIDKHLVINEEQATFVRDLFEMFGTGDYSLNQLEKIFYAKGYRSTTGGRINHAAMAQVIRNPKYKGWFCGGKTTVMDPFDQRQIKIPKEEWIMYPDENIPALVSEETWQKANAILEKRSQDVISRRGQYTHANLLSCKMYCAHCNALYHRHSAVTRHDKMPNSTWVCSTKRKQGAHTCPSRHIWESEMKTILFSIFTNFHSSKDDMMQRIMDSLERIEPNTSVTKDITKTEDAIERLKARRNKLIDLNLKGMLSDEELIEMMAECSASIEEHSSRLEKLRAKQNSSLDIKKRLALIREAFASFETLETPEDITPALVDAVIKRIDVAVVDSVISLNIQLVDGTAMQDQMPAAPQHRARRAAEKRNQKCSAGHSRKRLIEQAEKSMANKG